MDNWADMHVVQRLLTASCRFLKVLNPNERICGFGQPEILEDSNYCTWPPEEETYEDLSLKPASLPSKGVFEKPGGSIEDTKRGASGDAWRAAGRGGQRAGPSNA